MSNVHDRVIEKVEAIFRELAGDRAGSLKRTAHGAMKAMADALQEKYGAGKAREIAFHLADWHHDAAFIVAWLLYPDRFAAEELDAGAGLFLIHAPSHIRAACHLTGDEEWVDFYDDQATGPDS